MKKLLFSANELEAAVNRVADDLAAAFPAGMEEPPVLVGVQQLGVVLAAKLQEAVKNRTGVTWQLGKLDITMYRDDIGDAARRLPVIRETVIPFDVNNAEIILVDDVLSTGRTIRAALDALVDYGRAKLIRLAVLVDREDPEFPIKADFVGLRIAVAADRRIAVDFGDNGGECGIYEEDWRKD